MSERPGHKSPHIVGYVRNQYPWGARPSTDIRMVNWSELQQMTLYVQPRPQINNKWLLFVSNFASVALMTKKLYCQNKGFLLFRVYSTRTVHLDMSHSFCLFFQVDLHSTVLQLSFKNIFNNGYTVVYTVYCTFFVRSLSHATLVRILVLPNYVYTVKNYRTTLHLV